MSNIKHGLSKTSEHRIWRGLFQRCYNKNNPRFHLYGGRGIVMSESWKSSFLNFYADMGERPSSMHSLDRVDNGEGYCKENCRWATQTEQCNNRRGNVRYSYDGYSLTLPEWSRKVRIPEITIRHRLKIGHTIEEALSTRNLRYGSILQSLK